METVDGDEIISEGQYRGSVVAKNSLNVQIADPVVYKLVRVEGDGRLVPATDDELMEFKDSFEDDKSEYQLTSTSQTGGCMTDEDLSYEKPGLEDSGLSKSEDAAFNMENPNGGHCQNSAHLFAPTSNEKDKGSLNIGECLNTADGEADTASIDSGNNGTLLPDFSMLKHDLYLHKLSIRELQATFKATFGRETSVKDKLWLKRRIAMGLINSCDVSTTTFIIENNKLVKGNDELCRSLDHALTKESVGASINCNNEMEGRQPISKKRLRNPLVECNHKIEDLHGDQRASKRVRKPTKRYIEELSDLEGWDSNGRLVSAINNHGHDDSFQEPIPSPLENRCSSEKTFVTRLDSLGGSGVYVPYVCRVRRSRPRKNFMALMKFHPSGMAAKLVKKALRVHCSQPHDKPEDQTSNAGASFKPFALPDTLNGNREDVVADHERSSISEDNNMITVPTAKGGMRRKHHRAWTLGEVMKLVDGVSKFGAGRWSEIKKLSFASHTHRTTVDLKDKWRNLLRASCAQTPAENAMNSRKHTSPPLPAAVFVRVRELAKLHEQGLQNFSSDKAVAV